MKRSESEDNKASGCMEKFKNDLKARYAYENMFKTRFLKIPVEGCRIDENQYEEVKKRNRETFEKIEKMFSQYF